MEGNELREYLLMRRGIKELVRTSKIDAEGLLEQLRSGNIEYNEYVKLKDYVNRGDANSNRPGGHLLSKGKGVGQVTGGAQIETSCS